MNLNYFKKYFSTLNPNPNPNPNNYKIWITILLSFPTSDPGFPTSTTLHTSPTSRKNKT
jgi:hypothetical protein